MNGTQRLRGGMAGLALGLAASFGIALPASAQAQALAGPGWTAWLGCWEPVPADGASVPAVTPYLCFLPGSDASRVETVTVERGAIANRQTLDASGSAISVTRDECTGTEAMEWSEDVTRIYQRSTFVCPGGLQRQTTGIFSMTATGEWLDVAAVSVGEATNVRVMRYRPAAEVESTIPEIAQALNGRALSRETARAAAMAPVERTDLLEAASHVHAGALEGWIIELGQPFRMDRQRVVEMADAGLPERVIDVMVALSYPDVFAIDRAGRPTEVPAQATPGVGGLGMMDPWVDSYNYLGLLRAMYPGYYLNSYYFYDPIYSPYGYGGYGYNYGGFGPGYNRPIIIVVPEGGEGDNAAEGRAVNGRGYTRGGSDAGSSGASRSLGGSSDSGSSSSSGSGNSGASSGGSSGGGSSTGRTARPKD